MGRGLRCFQTNHLRRLAAEAFRTKLKAPNIGLQFRIKHKTDRGKEKRNISRFGASEVEGQYHLTLAFLWRKAEQLVNSWLNFFSVVYKGK